MILSICDLPEVLKVMRIVNIVITIIKIVVPILLILSVMIDFTRAVMDSELNKITKPMVNKVIAAVVVFLIPTFVKLIADVAGNDGEYSACLGSISNDTINAAYNSKEEELVKKSEESNNINDYNSALIYSNNIKDEDKKEEYLSRLEKVKEKIDEANKANKASTNTNAKKNNTDKIIFLGDSRTEAYNYRKSYLGINDNTEIIIAQASTGYDSRFHSQMQRAQNEIINGNKNGHYYSVTVNYGVNKLPAKERFCEDYVSFVKDMDSKNDFYIVAVTPVNDNISGTAKNYKIEDFNNYMNNTCINKIKEETNKNVFYCDVYNKIPLKEWSKYINSSGIHFTSEGYKFIYDSIKECIQK